MPSAVWPRVGVQLELLLRASSSLPGTGSDCQAPSDSGRGRST